MWVVDKLGHGNTAKLHGSPHLRCSRMFRTEGPQNEKAPPTINYVQRQQNRLLAHKNNNTNTNSNNNNNNDGFLKLEDNTDNQTMQ